MSNLLLEIFKDFQINGMFILYVGASASSNCTLKLKITGINTK